MKTERFFFCLSWSLYSSREVGFFAFSNIFSEGLRKRKFQFPSLHLILKNKTKRLCRSGYRGRFQLAHAGKISRQDKAGKCRLVYEMWTIKTAIIPWKWLIIIHLNLLASTDNQEKAISCNLSLQAKMLVWKAEEATTTATTKTTFIYFIEWNVCRIVLIW